jgi:hypothetical protein
VQLLGSLQFLPLLAEDELVHRLGDAHEGDLPRDLQKRQPDLVRGSPHRVGETRKVVRDRQAERRHAVFGQAANQFGQFLVASRPGDPRAEHQHAAVDPRERIGQVDDVHPADTGVEPPRPGDDARAVEDR